MADPTLYPPPVFSEDEIRQINLPSGLKPKTIQHLKDANAGYHRIYQVTFEPAELSQYIPAAARDTSRQDSLILRISGKHFMSIKTCAEIDTISYLNLKTGIPVPSVLWYSDDASNPLGHEYMYLTHAKGQSFDVIYRQLIAIGDQEQLQVQTDALLSQMVDILIELTKTKWSCLGSIRRNIVPAGAADGNTTNFIIGPLLSEQFWHEPEFEQFWGGKVTYSDLNPGGPFTSWSEMELAKIEKYIWMIEHHESLEIVRQHLPRIRELSDAIRKHAAEINDTTYVLAHRDLHMGNIMYDGESRKVTAVIDWEFASVMPAPLTDAAMGSLLWDYGPNGISESTRGLQRRLKSLCKGRGADVEVESRYNSPRQEAMMDAVNYLRAVTEVLPRGQVERNWKGWVEEMLLAINTIVQE
ncbi:hypothetical protein K431DRAFT_280277 [Polychaeton citri CBS 116435]|uniref:Aminoglycoside phosphotransferase domain-containing protein n=1 Tax=Polychaeton citri CBS 116435 TaxID=1314669 RepID=A0A9P4QI93_9PEZI|nr:hypothetical protein K431DRAFT_280277 [Polychaeton citri CBS 116435]